MKFRAEILSVETTGTSLRVKAQAEGERDAAWRPMQVLTFEVPALPVQQRAFYVGRILEIEVTPK